MLRVSFRWLHEEKSRNVITSFSHGCLVLRSYLQHSHIGIMNLKFKKKNGTKYKNKNYLYRGRVEGAGMDEMFRDAQGEEESKEGTGGGDP